MRGYLSRVGEVLQLVSADVDFNDAIYLADTSPANARIRELRRRGRRIDLFDEMAGKDWKLSMTTHNSALFQRRAGGLARPVRPSSRNEKSSRGPTCLEH